MQISKFTVQGLFGHFNHKIEFPTNEPIELNNSLHPSVVILYGSNGVGKTTLLRMIHGLITLDFDMFRKVPFKKCDLQFSHNSKVATISVQAVYKKNLDALEYLVVTFRQKKIKLHPSEKGPLTILEKEKVESFRQYFLSYIDSINFELIDSERSMATDMQVNNEVPEYYYRIQNEKRETVHRHPKRFDHENRLSEKIKKFILQSRVHSRRYFKSSQPDFFKDIINKLGSKKLINYKVDDLISKIDFLRKQETLFEFKRLELNQDTWDYSELEKLLHHPQSMARQSLSIIGALIEVLESGFNEKVLLAKRLVTFEKVINDFFLDKKILISPSKGFEIKLPNGECLTESQLSSGEYHLLYLMVTALVTTRRGTVIAIDEPELSMHISWQRKLVDALVKCASDAEPQFVFVTHSPEIAADYYNSMIQLK